MYNRYIPESMTYVRAEAQPDPSHKQTTGKGKGDNASGRRMGQAAPFLPGMEGLASLLKGKERNGLVGLLDRLRPDNFDTGDVLLLLILLLLLLEGEDMEPVIALGLVLLMGLWEEEKAD